MSTPNSVSFFALVVVLCSFAGCSKTPVSELERGTESGTSANAPQTVPADSNRPDDTLADEDSDQKSSAIPTSLEIGDAAPALQIAEWIKGEPVEAYQNDKIYVIEFWATWCGPCRAGMPHISELQEEYAEQVRFVGITKEGRGLVESFLEQEADASVADEEGATWNDLMRYTVAIDNPARATSQSFMEAANERGIPTAFVVGYDNKIEWIGHPASIDKALREIVSRNWDRDLAIAERKEAQEAAARQQKFSQALSEASRAEDWDRVLELLDEIESELPESFGLMNFRLITLIKAKRAEQAVGYLVKLAERYDQEAGALNALAWTVAKDELSPTPLLEKSLALAERACELTDSADGNMLDTLARVHYELRDLDQAIRFQTLAAKASPSNATIRETLARYTSENETEVDSESAPTEDAEASDPEIKNEENESPAKEEL